MRAAFTGHSADAGALAGVSAAGTAPSPSPGVLVMVLLFVVDCVGGGGLGLAELLKALKSGEPNLPQILTRRRGVSARTGLSHLPGGAPGTAARGLASAEALLHLVHCVGVVPGSAGTPP